MDSYEMLLERVGEEKFKERFEKLVNSANVFITEAKYEDSVECNERIMLNVLLDYFTDIFRLKDFHGIKKVRTDKIFAYTVAWIIKRKPLQFI